MAWLLRYGAHVWQSPWQVKALYQKVLAIFEEAGEERGEVETLYRLGWVATQLGDYQEAEQLFQDSLGRARKLGRQDISLFCLYELGYVQWIFGNYQAAENYCRESIAISKEIGYRSQIAYAQRYLARIALNQSDPQTARQYLQDSLTIYEELGLRGLKAETLGEMGYLTLVEQDFATATQLAQHSLDLCRELEHQMGEIVPYTVLGEAALGLGNRPEAEAHFQTALRIALEVWVPSQALHTLVGMARLLAAGGDKEKALELATFISQHPASWQWSKDGVAPLAAQWEAELPANVGKAARIRGKENKLERVVEELTKYNIQHLRLHP